MPLEEGSWQAQCSGDAKTSQGIKRKLESVRGEKSTEGFHVCRDDLLMWK